MHELRTGFCSPPTSSGGTTQTLTQTQRLARWGKTQKQIATHWIIPLGGDFINLLTFMVIERKSNAALFLVCGVFYPPLFS